MRVDKGKDKGERLATLRCEIGGEATQSYRLLPFTAVPALWPLHQHKMSLDQGEPRRSW